MNKEDLFTPKLLHVLLRHDPDAGLLYWRWRDIAFCANEGVQRDWNDKYCGELALNSLHDYGYLYGKILDVSFYAHRVMWAMETGEWPEDQLDHIDHDRTHNRLTNLRDATNSVNGKNQRLPSDNTSGVIGVRWNKADRKWIARIQVNGKPIHLGSFTEKQDAIDARKAANIEHGFHANHGS